MKIMSKKSFVLSLLSSSLWDVPTPSSLSYMWNFGSMLGICLIFQILSGIFLTFHYISFSPESFSSIINIMRETWSGWIIRMVHMNGASLFFFMLYMHLFRGLYFLSSSHIKVWISGVTILILLMAISFLGYVLPWGQMSYWAVAVITNLFSIVPLMGESLVNWIWGGFSVGSPTLSRFYSFHFFFPFILVSIVIFHLYFLHEQGSSNNIGVSSMMDKIKFHPYFSVKDTYFIFFVILIIFSVSFISPYVLGDPVNNVPANPLQTPIHIQPEWYFLPFYAILRSLPSKTSGVLALAFSVLIFYIIPIFKFNFSTNFMFARILMFWFFFFSFFFLMKMGALPAEEPYIFFSKIGMFFYFVSILVMNI